MSLAIDTTRCAAIYTRVSTAGQGKGRDPWHSLPRQREALFDLAARLGYRVVVDYAETISGARSDRPGFRDMMNRVRAGEVDAILAVDVTRLTRTESLGEWEGLKAELRQAGAVIATMSHLYTLTGAEEELSTDVLAAASKYERTKIRDRTMEARVAAAAAGRFTGHPTPYGWRTAFDPATGARRFEVDEQQAEVVRAIARMYLDAREGVTDIAKRLDADGVPPPGSRRTWDRNAVRYILDSPKYAGVSSFRGGQVQAASVAFPAILPMATWEAIRQARERRRTHHRHGPGRPWPLSGILRCPGCGGGMGIKGRGAGDTERHALYICQRHVYHRGGICPAPFTCSSDGAHRAVLAWLKRELPRLLDERERRAAREAGRERPDDGALAAARADLLDAERRRQALLVKVADGELGRDDVAFTLADLRRQVESARGKVEQMETARAVREDRADQGQRLRPLASALRKLTTESPDLREVFEQALGEVRITYARRDPKNHRKKVYRISGGVWADGETFGVP